MTLGRSTLAAVDVETATAEQSQACSIFLMNWCIPIPAESPANRARGHSVRATSRIIRSETRSV
jgi:hypothetical protein